jgi:hypothetical protein
MGTPNSIQTIKDYFNRHNGVQLTNRFDVTILNAPPGDIELQAQNLDIGPRGIATVQDNLYGYGGGRFIPRHQNLIAGGFGVVITFPVTNDNHILDYFNQWFNTIHSAQGNFILPYYDTIIKPVQMDVGVLNPNGQPNSIFTFEEVFPVETQPISFSMKENLPYQVYTVVFGYRGMRQTFYSTD